MKRRNFIRGVSGSSALLALSAYPFEALAARELVKITILHTNDVHSHIDPFPENDPKYPGLGGVARRARLIEKIRKDEENVLLIDAGDIFQGTPYFNMYGGEVELQLMSKMGYEASTIGNHDFDNGLEGLITQMPNASFPFICSNYDFSDTPLYNKTIPYKIFNKGGVKIGIFGLGIELKDLVDPKLYGNTRYLNPVEKAAYWAHFLKKERKCDLVICLSHLGYKYRSDKICDTILAKKSKNIDLIIGGHTHTFVDNPFAFKNFDNKDVMVCQVGWAGIKLGRIDYMFSVKKRKNAVIASKALWVGSNNTQYI